MQNNFSKKKIFKLNNYELSYPEDMNVSLYSNSCYYGIKFIINNHVYDVTHNYNLGDRLIIDNEHGWKDIPFKKETFSFLPSGIEVKIL